MEEPVIMQRYVPGVEPGPRAWKKEMREAGVPDEFVAVVERMRAKVRDEARLGTPIGIEYAFDVLKRDGAEEPRLFYVMTITGERHETGASCSFGPPPDGDGWDDVLLSFSQNVENCKRWIELPTEPEGER